MSRNDSHHCQWTGLAAFILLGASTSLTAEMRFPVYRCISEEGARIYSDHPCSPHAVLLSRGSLSPPLPGSLSDLDPMCPAPDIESIPRAVEIAFASQDANAVASLYHWPGLTSRDARELFHRFEQLLAMPPHRVPTPPFTGSPPQILLAMGPPQSPRHVRFEVIEKAGCAWLRFADTDLY